jgi:hypothetical protein
MDSENLLCLLDREDFALVAAGFEPTEEEGTLWRRDGVWFGREAALQSVWKNLPDTQPRRGKPVAERTTSQKVGG